MNQSKKIYTKMKYTEIEIYNAKNYMQEYKNVLEDYNLHVGWLSRFFNKLFGISAYVDIEKYLKHEYNLDYVQASQILYYSGNKDCIFDPFHILEDKK